MKTVSNSQRSGKLSFDFFKKFSIITFPVICQAIIMLLVGTIDLVFVGNYSPENVASVGVALELFQIALTLGASTSIAIGIFVAQYSGQKNYSKVKETIRIGYFLGFVIVALTFLVLFLAGKLLMEKLLSLDPRNNLTPAQIEQGFYFLKIILISFIFQVYAIINYSALQTLGFTRMTLIIALVGFGTNFLFNYILGGFLKLGLAGIAYATLIARFMEAFLLTFIFLTKKVRDYNPFGGGFRISLMGFANIQKQFWPIIIISNGVYQIVVFVNRILIIRFGGLDSYSATVLCLPFIGILVAFWSSSSIGASHFIGQPLGSNNPDLAIGNAKRVTKLYYLVIFFASAIMIGLAWLIVKPMFPSVDPEIVNLAILILNFQIVGFVFSSGSVLFINFLRIGGKSAISAFVDILFSSFHQVLFVWILYAIFELNTFWVFFGIMCLEVVQLLIYVVMVLTIKWARNITVSPLEKTLKENNT